MNNDLEIKLYQMMCKGCPNQRMCHDTAEYCDEYLLIEAEMLGVENDN